MSDDVERTLQQKCREVMALGFALHDMFEEADAVSAPGTEPVLTTDMEHTCELLISEIEHILPKDHTLNVALLNRRLLVKEHGV